MCTTQTSKPQKLQLSALSHLVPFPQAQQPTLSNGLLVVLFLLASAAVKSISTTKTKLKAGTMNKKHLKQRSTLLKLCRHSNTALVT